MEEEYMVDMLLNSLIFFFYVGNIDCGMLLAHYIFTLN